jgi:CBS domain-containing protein
MGFLGLFLLNMASTAAAQAKLQQKLGGVKVDEVMSRNHPTIPGETTLDQLVVATLSNNSQGIYLVVDDGQPVGVLSLGEITQVPRHQWSRTRAREVMKSWGNSFQVAPDTPVLTALQEMESEGLGLVPVVEGLQVLGVLSRERVLNYLRLRTELGS